MTTIRKHAAHGMAAVIALVLAAPASAKHPPNRDFPRVAKIDCGDGVRQVGSNDPLWAPLTDLRNGEKYKPVAWNVAGDGFAVSEGKNQKGGTVCAYDDGEATGTVTIRG